MSDTDECEPLAEPKAKAARRNFQSTWLEKFKWLTLDPTDWSFASVFLKRVKIHELDH